MATLDLDRSGRAGCLWPVAAGAAAALAAGRKSLAADEAMAVSTAGRPLRDLLDHVVSADPGQALYLLVLHPVARLDDAEWAARAPSAAAAVLAVALTNPLGAQLFGPLAGLAK